jgi:hypothetical protein
MPKARFSREHSFGTRLAFFRNTIWIEWSGSALRGAIVTDDEEGSMQNMDATTGAIMATLVLAGVSTAPSICALGRDETVIRERPRVVPEILEIFADWRQSAADRVASRNQLLDD